MKQEKILEIESELSDLKSRARAVGYKNEIPTLSKKLKSQTEDLQSSTMTGFYKRLSNWTQKLMIMENPGSLVYAQTKVKQENELNVATASLIEHFSAQ